MPFAGAVEVELKVRVWNAPGRLLRYGPAEKAGFRQTEQPVDVEPGVGAADGRLRLSRSSPGRGRRPAQPQIGAARIFAQGQAGKDVKAPEQALRLVPRIAGEPLV